MRRMLNQSAMLPVQAWYKRIRGYAAGDREGSGGSHVRLRGDVNDDLSF